MKNNWFYISLICGLCLAVLYFWESPSQILKSWKISSTTDTHTPYSIISKAKTQHFDKGGKLSYEFFTETLKHFRLDLSKISEDDYTALESPKLTLYTNDGPWYVTALEGKATDNGNILTLWKNVKIWQNAEQNDQQIELLTDELVIEPVRKRIHTGSQVIIRSVQGQLEARGMEVNLLTRKIKLLNQVKGRHEPIQ